MSYEAIICKIHTREHPKADNLKLGVCAGSQVIVGLATENETLGVFFPEGGQLSEKMLFENSLYRVGKGENKDPDAKNGYFEEKRRVRTLKLRGEKSEGLWLPLTSLDWLGTEWTEGQRIEDGRLAIKYITPAQRYLQGRTKVPRTNMVPDFRQHYSTPKLRYSLAKVLGQHVSVTEKLHGTSGRTGHHKVTQKRTLWDRLMRRTRTEYQYVTGTRRTILSLQHPVNEYRLAVHENLKSRGLRKGETLYYEIVGFDPDGGGGIMPNHTAPKDAVGKVIKKQYGEQITYSYGCDISTTRYKVYVYRITVSVDGDVFDLSWEQVKTRCSLLGLDVVPELKVGAVLNQTELDQMASGHSVLDSMHPREGICVRMGDDVFKYKSFEFCHLEGIAANSDDYVDPEEAV